jgi:hypothetical protein
MHGTVPPLFITHLWNDSQLKSTGITLPLPSIQYLLVQCIHLQPKNVKDDEPSCRNFVSEGLTVILFYFSVTFIFIAFTVVYGVTVQNTVMYRQLVQTNFSWNFTKIREGWDV